MPTCSRGSARARCPRCFSTRRSASRRTPRTSASAPSRTSAIASAFPIAVASFRNREQATPLEYETMLARVAEARYVFAGPGSPSYALRQWLGTAVPDLLAAKLRDGGCVTLASAAAVGLGVCSLPVYEVYKVGEEPRWLDGLDLLSVTGLRAAVVPALQQRRGRHARHPVLLHGRAPPAHARGAPARTASTSSVSTSTPRRSSTSMRGPSRSAGAAD